MSCRLSSMVLVVCVSMLCARAQADTSILATADIFNAGRAAPDASRGGTLPTEIDLPMGSGRTI
jgi:hypothetical protein